MHFVERERRCQFDVLRVQLAISLSYMQLFVQMLYTRARPARAPLPNHNIVNGMTDARGRDPRGSVFSASGMTSGCLSMACLSVMPHFLMFTGDADGRAGAGSSRNAPQSGQPLLPPWELLSRTSPLSIPYMSISGPGSHMSISQLHGMMQGGHQYTVAPTSTPKWFPRLSRSWSHTGCVRWNMIVAAKGRKLTMSAMPV